MLARLATALWLAAALPSCGGGLRPELRYGGAVLSTDVERGREVFRSVCGPCHVDHDDRRAPALSTVHLPAWAIRRQVREGDLWMTAIPLRRLSHQELEDVLAYFVTTGTCTSER